MNYFLINLAGAFLCNCIPHLAAGLQGAPFPTPFAKPRGVGNSSSLVNFLWGTFNLVVGIALLVTSQMQLGLNAESGVLLAGFLALGLYLSIHFGRVRSG